MFLTIYGVEKSQCDRSTWQKFMDSFSLLKRGKESITTVSHLLVDKFCNRQHNWFVFVKTVIDPKTSSTAESHRWEKLIDDIWSRLSTAG